MTSVITAPAPNRRGAAMFTSNDKLAAVFLRRANIIFRAAVHYGYRNLVLGAWGCGAFGNDPRIVAEAFKSALKQDGLEMYFDKVCFAVYGNEASNNYRTFKLVFK